jgi:hypothetical protein
MFQLLRNPLMGTGDEASTLSISRIEHTMPHLVWFKRDLRPFDHAAGVAACEPGRTLPL